MVFTPIWVKKDCPNTSLVKRVSAFENLSKTGNERFEFIYPEASLEKNLLMSESLGIVDLKSELLVEVVFFFLIIEHVIYD